MLILTEIWETCSTAQKHETGRLMHTSIEKNVTTIDEMVGLLNHEGQKQTYRSIRQISKEMDLTMCSIVCSKVYFVYQLACCLLLLVFSCIRTSQDTVVTQLLMCGGIFNNHFIANCPKNTPVKEFLKLVIT